MSKLNFWQNLLQAGLQDDDWQWDWTGLAVQKEGRPAKAKIIAKEDGIWAADGLVAALEVVSRELGYFVEVSSKIKDRDLFTKGQLLMEWSGSDRMILALERTFLNLASYACGIAKQTQSYVQEIQKLKLKNPPRILCTRKILPHYRDLALHALLVGGGHAHRMKLSGGVLIKENHIQLAGGIASAVKSAREKAPHSLQLEVEVRGLEELKHALQVSVDAVMLDNFSPELVREALKAVMALTDAGGKRPLIEVSGGINLTNIKDYAQEGVDVISIGALTHSVKATDLSLLVV